MLRRTARLFASRYREIEELVDRPVALMEVCGTHTMAIARAGLRARLPKDLRLLSGPGCPVCVTPVDVIDRLVAMAREPGVTVATFGDLLRVPGSRLSLAEARARGADVRVVYSPVDALALARREPKRLVVFPGVGFETTSPTVAAALLRARAEDVENFLVLPAFRRVVPAMVALAEDPERRIAGFLGPGHVSVILGRRAYLPVAAAGVDCVIAGFDPIDILDGVATLLARLRARRQGAPGAGDAAVVVGYRRAVSERGNREAQRLLEQVFARCDARWRGIGVLPNSGFDLRPEFARWDARRRLPVAVAPARELPPGCACGRVMLGRLLPTECPRFGRGCTPARPLGPCMVSSEGACAAWFRFGDRAPATTEEVL